MHKTIKNVIQTRICKCWCFSILIDYLLNITKSVNALNFDSLCGHQMVTRCFIFSHQVFWIIFIINNRFLKINNRYIQRKYLNPMYNSKIQNENRCTQVIKLQRTKLIIEILHFPFQVLNEKHKVKLSPMFFFFSFLSYLYTIIQNLNNLMRPFN